MRRILRRLLVDGLVVLGIAVNVGFLFINLRPERPHLGRRTKARILLRASEPRIKWMRENQFAEFAIAKDVDFELVAARTFEEVHQKLLEEKQHPTGLLLADVDDEHADELKDGGLVRPIADGADPAELRQTLGEFMPEATARGAVDGKQWYLPKRALVNVAVYLRPAIEDAYLHWEEGRKAIDAALKEANGVGLPKDFRLRRTPDRWDSFDLFVAAWTWAHHPARWAEASRRISADTHVAPVIAPRVAWRRQRGRLGRAAERPLPARHDRGAAGTVRRAAAARHAPVAGAVPQARPAPRAVRERRSRAARGHRPVPPAQAGVGAHRSGRLALAA